MLVALSEEQANHFRIALQSEGYPVVILQTKQEEQNLWFVCRNKKEAVALMPMLS